MPAEDKCRVSGQRYGCLVDIAQCSQSLGVRGVLDARLGVRRARPLETASPPSSDLHAGELADAGLEVEERLHAALADLRLVRRVRSVPWACVSPQLEDSHAFDFREKISCAQRRFLYRGYV